MNTVLVSEKHHLNGWLSFKVQGVYASVCMVLCVYVCVCKCVCMFCVCMCVCMCRTVQPDLLVVSDGSSLRLTNMAVSSIKDIIHWEKYCNQ